MSDCISPTPRQKQVMTLSWLSNGAGTHIWDRLTLQSKLDYYQSNIGAWKVVWGPYYCIPDYDPHRISKPIAANTMFIAQDGNSYVIAIAGTNPLSTFDWLSEDWDTTPIAWPYSKDAGIVTAGNLIGLKLLLNNLWDASKLGASPSDVQKPQTFLASLPNKRAIDLTITGHSLGGALAPLLALALMDPKSTLNIAPEANVSADKWQQVYVMATAGPSPCDKTLVDYFNQAVATANQHNPNQWTNDFIWNKQDIVPHAWAEDTLRELIPSFYPPITLHPAGCVYQVIQNAQTKVQDLNYTQFNSVSSFCGPIQPYTGSSKEPAYLWDLMPPQGKFLAQAIYQHINAYINAFECTWLPSPKNPCANPLETAIILGLFIGLARKNHMCGSSLLNTEDVWGTESAFQLDTDGSGEIG